MDEIGLDMAVTMNWKLNEISSLFTEGMTNNVRDGCRTAVAYIQRSMHDPRISTESGMPKGHSAPGEPPWVQLNNLRRAIKYKIEHNNILGGEISAKIGVLSEFAEDEAVRIALAYARPLEYGAPAINLAPRPYLRPAIDILAMALVNILGRPVL